MPEADPSHTPPTISVCINNYNYGQYLGDCINSVLKQRTKPLEIIIVDDGSTDNSDSILQNFKDDTIQIKQANQGQAAAINTAYKASNGNLILFLDADDRLLPDAIEEITSGWIHGHSKLQYPMELIDSKGHVTGLMPKPEQALPRGDMLPELLMNGTYRWMPTSGNVFSRATLDRIMPIPEKQFRISADQYLSIRCVRYAPIQSFLKPLAQYRLHDSNAFSSNRIFPPDSKSFASRIASHRNRHQIMTDEAAWSNYELPAEPKSYYTTFYAWVDITLSLRYMGEESIRPYQQNDIYDGVVERIKRKYPKRREFWKAWIIRIVFMTLLYCPQVILKPLVGVCRRLEPSVSTALRS